MMIRFLELPGVPTKQALELSDVPPAIADRGRWIVAFLLT